MDNQKKEPRLGENKMGTMSEGKLLFNMAMPLVISMLVQALYNVVDSIYVAAYSESAVTALSLAFPIQNLQIGCASGIAVGVNSLLSKSLGEGDRERANRAAGNGIFLTVILTLGFMLFGFFGAGAYYNMQPISQETAWGGTQYTAICCIFTIGVFVQILGERLLQATGRTVYTMIAQSVGAITNIILDPLFIFGFAPLGIPEMGVAGAAIATVIGQWIGAMVVIVFNLKCNPEIKFRVRYILPKAEALKKILTVGVPSAIMMAIGSVMNFGMNQILLGFPNIGETASGVFGVYFKLQSFFFMPVFGMNNAAVSIVAYNYGARQPKRITKTLWLDCGSAMGIMLLGLGAFQIFPEFLMGIFTEESTGHFVSIGVNALRTISLVFPLAAIGIALSASFQGLGNGIYATITSLCRQLVLLLPAAYLLSFTGNVNAVWWAFPIAEVGSFAVTMFCYRLIYKKRIKPLYS